MLSLCTLLLFLVRPASFLYQGPPVYPGDKGVKTHTRRLPPEFCVLSVLYQSSLCLANRLSVYFLFPFLPLSHFPLSFFSPSFPFLLFFFFVFYFLFLLLYEILYLAAHLKVGFSISGSVFQHILRSSSRRQEAHHTLSRKLNTETKIKKVRPRRKRTILHSHHRILHFALLWRESISLSLPLSLTLSIWILGLVHDTPELGFPRHSATSSL